ncbi:hypothetical protein QJS10_CPB18g00675 [Acorus calamus]|uniref:Uncharacterized protein n=1 Tax=Acorus calamus TaxID=4465 RepID=A0AAV9CN79_ACOCL|nr:hypothetical protein QJS10_CPB18g00675 [Acorus calamus]
MPPPPSPPPPPPPSPARPRRPTIPSIPPPRGGIGGGISACGGVARLGRRGNSTAGMSPAERKGRVVVMMRVGGEVEEEVEGGRGDGGTGEEGGGAADAGEGGGGGEETEEEKKMRVRRELEKLAREQAERRETAKLMFELGQKAYGRGMYGRAIEFLEGALTIIPRLTFFGGEIQIWLAMAYEANNRHRDCIALYQQLEKQHPSVAIRRQAADILYIMQAPKLKISKDEMVTIPLIGSSYDSYAASWSGKYKDREQRKTTAKQSVPSSDYWGDFFLSPPKGWEKDRAFGF